jgi:hypothetical protein
MGLVSRNVIIVSVCVFLFILVVYLTREKISQDTGYFSITYNTLSEQKKYSKYVNSGAGYWSDILTTSHPISVSVRVYSNANSSTIASASISSTNSNRLATRGVVNINSTIFDGLTSSTKYNAIKHEIGHILGVGYWTRTAGTGSGARIVGTSYPTSLSEFNSLTGSSFTVGVPIESSGGSGTIGAHWENDYRSNFAETGLPSKGLKNELMAGYIGSTAFVSGVTLGYLKDIGWNVDISKKDPDEKFTFDLEVKTGLEVRHSGGCGICNHN